MKPIATKVWHREWAREFFDDRRPTAEELDWIDGRRGWEGAVDVSVNDLAELLAEAYERGVRDASPALDEVRRLRTELDETRWQLDKMREQRWRPIPEGVSTMRSDDDGK